ncbi:tail fiber protein [Flavobacterium sp. MC2016-06]|uniref:tail fiber protein n=1 Tax=Flavobacterium sp. MC2016-06 TaxID=2676308 RepID=UPI0012BAA60A|nr:tail fiber protein [Flavobacterium sp. MC2016-06]MBU3858442.1 hypothetical protein [Flavobacterium sp. MC2016-06]
MKLFNLRRNYILFLIFIKSSIFYSQNLPIVGFGDISNYRVNTYDVPGSSGLDLHWYGGIRFGDKSGNNVMQITNGNVGIGTTNPRAYFDMGQYISNGQIGTVLGRLGEGDGVGSGTFLGVQGYATQGDDFRNVKSFSLVHNFYGQTNNSINFYRGSGMTGGFMTFCTYDNTEKMRIDINGYIGIGTTAPDEMLTVKGKIHTQEIRVDMKGPLVPDYVFATDYKLKSLEEVENYIKQNNHLPEIPSAQEIEKNGLMLAEMNMNLLKKMEEITLYIIDFKKEMDALKQENKIQEEEIQKLKKQNKI